MELERSQDEAAVNQITRLIDESDLDPVMDVGELILDITDHYGTEAANSAESDDEAENALDVWSQIGSDLNNEGSRAQAEVLVAFHGAERARELILGLA